MPNHNSYIKPSLKLSWIRRWFMRQDDFTLWAIGFIWLIIQIAVALAIIARVLKALTT